MIRLFTLGLLALGCRAGQNYDDVYEGPVHGKVSGLVTSIDGSPLSGVNVSAQDVSAVTSEDGTYTLLDMDPGENIVVQFSKEGYARNYTTATLHSWETAASNASLIEADGFVAIDSTTPSNVEVFGTKIRFLENSFFNSDGSQYTGEVTVQVTHVDPSTQEVWGAPTDLTAIGHSTPSDGRAKDVSNVSQLVSYGMVDVALFGSDGQELNISSDTPAFLEIPITNGDLPEVYQLTPGDTQASWSFDPQVGRWTEEGVGTIVEEDGVISFQFEASHFSWWNCDQGFVPSCASGRILDITGFPVRGAEVTCDGAQSFSTATTDDDGYFVCSVLVGDEVTFTATTVVDSRLWSQETIQFMDGEGSSAADCEPVKNLDIDVCRIAGTINVQNVVGTTEVEAELHSDNVGGFFWEPPGDLKYCNDPLESLSVGECWSGTHEEVQRAFPEGAIPGIPVDSRSVGNWLEIRTEKERYRIDQESVDSQPNYTWDNFSFDGVEVVDQRPEFNAGDILDVQAPGDYSSYFGAWEAPGFAIIPTATNIDSNGDASLSLGASLSVSYDGYDQDEVFVSAYSGDTQMFCKFEDDGNFTIQSTGLSSGWGGLSVFHLETDLLAGPDGLPIRTQVFSGGTIPLDIK
jgi:hypothetical protein|tara:strand:- start:349 stop:2244 length:1896 start_codon:yes stop_codon:yes gene_type:complete